MKKTSTFKMPNALICDQALSLSSRKVGAVLYAYRNAFGVCKKSYEDIARLSDLSCGTVRKAVAELVAAGYISAVHTYRYHQGKQRIVFGKNAYCCTLHFRGGYTLIPREVLRQRSITPGAFCICLYICMQAGKKRRAFPSISKISEAVGVARSTVCCALQQIRTLANFLVQLCRKANGAFCANSYFVVLSSSFSKHAQVADLPQSTPEKTTERLHPLRSFIIKLGERLHNLFSPKGVVRFLTNYS